MPRSEILIVGAGPTGLVLALWLAKSGVSVRIIDKTREPGTTSRALVVQARTLEFFRQLGFAETAIDRGRPFTAVNLWVGGRRAGRVVVGNGGAGVSRFPFMLVLPQDLLEQLLVEQLEAAGVRVERATELVSFTQNDDFVRATIRRENGAEELVEVAYLAAGDGAHSRVRETLAIAFAGGTYDDVYYVADIEATGPVADGETHVALDDADFLAMFPMKGAGRLRLVGAVLPGVSSRPNAGWDDVKNRVISHLPLAVDGVRWFSTYRVHHRVARAFRNERIFLLGDAAHIHSPVGGQGMNTGIGDAVNLGWKLAAVLRGRMPVTILDTYDIERKAFARTLVATTDRLFTFITARGRLATRLRLTLAPVSISFVFRLGIVRAMLFSVVSQTRINYRRSPLSVGRTAKLRAGDRLPWLALRGPHELTDNFASLDSRDWHVHVYGAPSAELRGSCEHYGLRLHAFRWRASMRRRGFRKNATYLMRPDGHIGFAGSSPHSADFDRYVSTNGIGSRDRN